MSSNTRVKTKKATVNWLKGQEEENLKETTRRGRGNVHIREEQLRVGKGRGQNEKGERREWKQKGRNGAFRKIRLLLKSSENRIEKKTHVIQVKHIYSFL